MLRPLKRKLSGIITLLALTLLTLFMQGCTNKETLISTPVNKPKIDFTPVIAELPIMDFNRTAKTEQEASLMAWDLYAYIKELEIKLKRLKDK